MSLNFRFLVKVAKKEGDGVGGGKTGGKDEVGEETAAEITHSDRFYVPTGSKEFVACVKKFIDSKNNGE